MRCLVLSSVCITALIITACMAKTETDPETKSVDVSAVCSELSKNNTHNEFTIETSQLISKKDSLPAFCQIKGTINPNIGYEARFPLEDWNGNYFQAGCGGFCGVVMADKEGQSNTINYALSRGYAAITTDAGHQGLHIGDGSWAKDNPAAEAVYAHKTLPLTRVAGHKMIKMLYNDAPNYSYFSGCSNGGRMGAMAAQRYPELFDGIISGCPVLNLSINGGAFGAWVLQAMSDEDGRRVLTHEFTPKLAMLEANSLEQCDEQDGRKDGIISKPLTCVVDLGVLLTCSNNSKDNCLTEIERSVIQKWYQGPVNTHGKQIFAGMAPGSERYWGHWYLGDGNIPGPGTLLADGYGTYLGFPEDPEGYNSLDFNFDTDVEKLTAQGRLFDALNPDLTAFKQAGGKMIMWHGLSDPLVLPNQSPQYYDAVEAEMGGRDNVQSFYRLFMVPGLGHCWDKPANAPDQMSMLNALENWVENGKAPNAIEVTQYYPESERPQRKGTLRPFPLDAEYGPLIP